MGVVIFQTITFVLKRKKKLSLLRLGKIAACVFVFMQACICVSMCVQPGSMSFGCPIKGQGLTETPERN